MADTIVAHIDQQNNLGKVKKLTILFEIQTCFFFTSKMNVADADFGLAQNRGYWYNFY